MTERNYGSINVNQQLLVSIATLLLLVSAPAKADENDRFELSAGGYAVFQYDSVVSLTETNVGVGISFSPRDTLGLDGEQTVFRVDGRYRFKPNHALTFSWYRINSSSNKALLDDIDWVDADGNTVTIPTGTSVSSSLGYDIYKVGYLWSFYRSDKVELTAGAGLHLADLRIELGVEANLFDSQLRSATSNVPMPVASFGLEYNVTSKFDWYLDAQFFALDLGEWRGIYSDFQLGVTYQVFENVGAGVALGSNSLEIVREYANDDVRFDFDNRVSGLYLFLSANF
jgi:Outer membrane protein beta-barrel domain